VVAAAAVGKKGSESTNVSLSPMPGHPDPAAARIAAISAFDPNILRAILLVSLRPARPVDILRIVLSRPTIQSIKKSPTKRINRTKPTLRIHTSDKCRNDKHDTNHPEDK